MSENTSLGTLEWVSFDCSDAKRAGRFWSEVLGLPVTGEGDDWLTIGPLVDGGPSFAFMVVPEGKTAKNRIHFDVKVDDLDAAVRRVEALGATHATGALAGPFGHKVMLDPEGNEFCLIPPKK